VITSRRLPRALLVASLVAVAIAGCGYTAFNAHLGLDYPGPPCSGCDFAGPPIEALAAGHVGRFFSTQPFMGSVTLLLRVPEVAVARAVGAGELTQYRIGSLICLLVCAGLAGMLIAIRRPQGREWLWAALLLGLLMFGPVTAQAMRWGHPEELVGALLCVAAVALAGRDRPVLAGVALGLGLATKQWAALAIIPVVIVCPRERLRLLGVTAAVAAVFILPMLIGDPGRFIAQNVSAGMPASNTGTFGVTATNVWFPYARLGGIVIGGGGTTSIYRLPSTLDAVTHPLMLVLGLTVPLIYWRMRKSRAWEEMLLPLALVFLLRCVLDPLTLSYHHLPFIATMGCYELLGRRRFPLVTIYSSAAIWALAKWVAPTASVYTLNQVYLAWALPLTAYLAYRVFGPRSHRAAAQAQHAGLDLGVEPA
jgi:hypothetical protein